MKLAAGCSDGSLIVWTEEGQKIYEHKVDREGITRLQWNHEAPDLLLISSCEKVNKYFFLIS